MQQVKTLNLSSFAITDLGNVRKKNEDAYEELLDEKFYVLADGLGGHKGGEIASKEAVKSVCFSVKRIIHYSSQDRQASELAIQLRFAYREANHLVNQIAKNNPEFAGMATTLCSILFHKNQIIYANVGDSRIYRLRNHRLVQLTRDHSVVSELIALGKISPEEANNSPHKNIVTKAIGIQELIDPDIKIEEAIPGDVYMLCSDGLSDFISSKEIETCLDKIFDLETCAHQLVRHAKNKGGGVDNITLILIRVEADSAS